DQHRLFRAKPLGDAGDVHGGIAAADHTDHTAEARRLAPLYFPQQGHGVDQPAPVRGRDIEAIGSLRSDGEEYGVEAALLLLGENVLHLLAAGDRHTHRRNACDLLADDVARQAIGGNAPTHHAARLLSRLANLHGMAESRQVIRAGKTGGAGADDEDAAPGRLTAVRLPFLLPSDIAHEPLDGVNAHRGVEFSSVTPALAGMITGPTVHGWKRIVIEDAIPRLPPSAGSRVLEPRLNILASRTSRIAGREVGDPVRQLPPCGSC